jgi:hypothetical protein
MRLKASQLEASDILNYRREHPKSHITLITPRDKILVFPQKSCALTSNYFQTVKAAEAESVGGRTSVLYYRHANRMDTLGF